MRTFLFVVVASLVLTACGGCAGPAYVAGKRAPLAVGPGVAHQEARFTGAREVSLFEESWAPEGQPPRGVLVIMHGLKDHADRYAAFAEELVHHGFAVQAFDLRGHGDSAGERVYVDSFEDYVTDLDGFLRTVQAQYPGKPVFLMGHSMGGAIATLAVIEKKSPVAGLVLSAPALKAGKEVNGFLIWVTGVLGSATPRAGVLDLPEQYFSRDPAVLAAMKSDPLVTQGAGPAKTAKELLGALDRIGKHMEDVTVPLLVLHGEADKITNPEGSKELVQRAKSTDKTLKLYPGLYHDLLHEPEKAQVAADVESWLEAHAK